MLYIVMVWAGGMTLSFGAEQKEKSIARQAVCGLWALAPLADPVAPLTPAGGVVCVIPFPALEQALFSQLEPAWSAGVALPAVSPFTCPARAVAAGTLVAVLISIIALWAVLHTGCVEKKADPGACLTLVLRRPRAVEALSVAGLALRSILIPVLGGATFLVGQAAPMRVHPQAFLTGGAGPRR